MRWLRVSIASFVVLTALNAAALTVPTPVAAWSAACGGGTSNLFLGNGKSASGLIGVYSEIQFTERSLCLQGPPGTEMPSWALSWVSIDGPQDDQAPGIDIYQGGYAKCPSDRVGSCPYNNGTSYIWHYYAHEQGACGLAYNTGFRYDMDVSSGFHDFQVSKVSGRYRFYVDEVQEGSRGASDIETC